MLKKIKVWMIVLMLSIVSCITVYGTNSIKIEESTLQESNSIFTDIVEASFSHNETAVNKYRDLFESDVYNRYIEYIQNNNLKSGYDKIEECVVDFTYPENSDTGDIVIIVNTKVDYKDGYNKIYLHEFHINNNNKVYGFNIWVY